MRRIYTLISVFLICGMLASPVCEAQRGRGNGSQSRTEQRSHAGGRPGNSGRPVGNNARPTGGSQSRPGGSGGNHGNNRPGNNNQGFRPNGGSHGNHRPAGGGNHGNNRPDGGGHGQGFGPGNHGGQYRPGHGNSPSAPGFRPGGHHSSHRPMPPFSHRPPSRPYMPAWRPWAPPVRPPHFRPGPRAPRFSSILGVTFGTALNISLNALFSAGYNVASYGNNVIYLNNVPLMNITWPYATLNYIDGSLRGSEFTFSSPAPDRSRYDMVYASLMNQYGYPVSVQNNGGAITSTWWGYDNGYVTLSYYPEYAANGMLRFYTTLSIGG